MKRGKRKEKGPQQAATPTASVDPFANGIELVGIWMSECGFKDFGFNRSAQEGEQAEDSEGDQIDVDHAGEVWFDEGGSEAIVRLTVTVRPESQPSFEARVGYVGHYRASDSPAVPLKVFAWTNGIAYLVPFVREKLAALTQASYYQAVYLQPFNLAALGESSEQAEHPSTASDLGNSIQSPRGP